MIERERPASRRSCGQVRQALQWYLDGALHATAAARLDEHLAVCRRCTRERDIYSAIKESLARRGGVPGATVERLREFGTALLDESD